MQINLRISRMFGAATMVLIAAGALAALAVAAPEQTRESYVAQVEPICKTNTKANERILAGVEKKVKEGKLKVAAGQFTQAAAAFGKAVKQLRAVPQPTADKAKLTEWLGYLGGEQKLLGEIGKALKAGKKSQASRLGVLLEHNGRQANNTVLAFEFNYCLIDQSRFS
jgi:hypothetical protein